MLLDKKLFDFIDETIDVGQGITSDQIKIVIFEKYPKLFKLLDFENDDIFLNPFLRAVIYGEDERIPVEQLLYGYIEPEKRPQQISIYAGSNGIVYLPQIGYVKTTVKDQRIQLIGLNNKDAAAPFRLEVDGKEIPFSIEPLYFAKDAGFEVNMYHNAVFDPIFYTHDNHRAVVEIDPEMVKRKLPYIEKALSLIKAHYPIYYNFMERVIKKIVLYHNPAVYSFASYGSHGIPYLSVVEENGLVFFLEDIIHQCAHNIFNVVTIDVTDFFVIDPYEPVFQHLPGAPEDKRGLYGAFHGLFTQTNINICFDILLEKNVLADEERHEMLGRMADDLSRWKKAMHNFDQPQIYTELGYELYQCLQAYEHHLSKKYEWLKQFDVSNQPYIFNFSKFLELNPYPAHQA